MFCWQVFGNISGGFRGISRFGGNFAEIPEFRGSATARNIRSPASRGHYLHGGVKMNFIFSWWKQYFTNVQSECVKYCFSPQENKIRIFKPLGNFTVYIFRSHTPSTNFIMNCCSSVAGISWSSLHFSNNFKSYKVFFFVLTFSCSSEEDFMSALDNFMHLSLFIFLLAFGKQGKFT